MKVSAVGFLFQNKTKGRIFPHKEYTCIIHKERPDGNYTRNVINQNNKSVICTISPELAEAEISKQLKSLTNPPKFVGATIQDGRKETEVQSFLSDKLFWVRTKDENGKNKLRVCSPKQTQRILAKNLYLYA